MSGISCWAVTDGAAGIENQVVGLAEALGLEPQIKRIRLRSPWKQLVPYFRLGIGQAFDPAGDLLTPPWPDLLLTSGRKAIAASFAVAGATRAAGRRCLRVHVQDPVCGAEHFDLLVVPRHDRLRADNVILTCGSLHRITPARLTAAARQFADRLAHWPRPRVAVLIGGANRAFRFTPAIAADMAQSLATLAQTAGASLLVTASRRTDPAVNAALRARLDGLPGEFWNGEGENPYFAYLALADAILVTCDSISMASEACATGKPVQILALPGGAPKFAAFHRTLQEAGHSRPFTGTLETWPVTALDDMTPVVAVIRQRLGLTTAGAPLTAVPAGEPA